MRNSPDQEDLTSSSEEGDGSNQRVVADSLQTRFKWKSNLDFLIISTVYSTTPYYYKSLLNSETIEMAHLPVILCLLIAMPILYMQVVLGQYCDRSILQIKYMSTLGIGVGMMFMVSSIVECAPNIVFAGDALLYILNCFQKTMPWMRCEVEDNQTCWSGKCDGPEPCINGNIVTATRLYWNRTHDHLHSTEFYINFKRWITIWFIWIIIFWCLSAAVGLSVKQLKWMFLITAATRFIILILMLIMCKEAYTGFDNLLHVNSKLSHLSDGQTWLQSVSCMLFITSIDKGGYMMFGSYMGRRQSAGNLTVLATVMAYFYKIFQLIMFHIALAVVRKAAKLPSQNIKLLIVSTREPVAFSIILNGLGYTHAPHALTVLFLIDTILEASAYFVLMIQACEIASQDIFTQYYNYKKYVRFGVILICQVICIPYVARGYFQNYMTDILPDIKNTYSTINLFLFALLVSWMYGVQRLCDDLHFITGHQPARFWKISWYFSPLLLGLCTAAQIRNLVKVGGSTGILILAVMLTLPFIMVILQSIKHMKLEDQGGFFVPEELWGPPNAMDRYLRAIFNPRKETKSRRRYDICQHKCLLQCSTLAKSSQELKERIINQKVLRRQVS